jgi:hypothetical protein
VGLFSKHGVRLAYTNDKKLKNHLGSPKNPVPECQKSGIYQVSCSGCQAVYVGQTRRNNQTRYKEHMAHIRRSPEKSSVASHVVDNINDSRTEHVIPIDSLRLLKEVRQRGKLDAYEGVFIHRYKNKEMQLMNADDGNVDSCLFSIV